MAITQQPLDWDHLRVFLAVMRAPSLRQAAEDLGVSHPTIRRKLEALETTLGLHLFDRRSDGLHATPAAAELLDTAETVEASVHALRRRAVNADPELRGSVRVSMPDIFATSVLMPDLVAFSEQHPNIELDVHASYSVADLDSREADVAVRAMPMGKSPDEHLTGRLAATVSRAVYGEPHQWIGWWGQERDRQWIAKTPYPDLPIKGRFDGADLQLAACKAGFGLTMLPCILCDGVVPRRSEPEPYVDMWVLVHPDLKRSPRLRVFRDAMVQALRSKQDALAGVAN